MQRIIRIDGIRKEKRRETCFIKANVHMEGTNIDGTELWFGYPMKLFSHLSSSAHPWIAALIHTAMQTGSVLEINAPASETFLRGAQKLMEIFTHWIPNYKVVDIKTASHKRKTSHGIQTASLFSGGVDSFYTVLKNLTSTSLSSDRISHLLFIRGFDIGLQEDELFKSILNNLNTASISLGCDLVACSTNIRETLVPRYAGWRMCHGQFLIAASLGIENYFKKMFIPSTHTYADSNPWGSHPLTDPLLSTGSLEFVHDGSEATRAEKIISQISLSPVALETLRVCWKNYGKQYNCGQCEKCIRTMTSLKIAGVLDKSPTFKRKLSYKDISNVWIREWNTRVMARENLDMAIKLNSDPRLIKSLQKSLSPWSQLRPSRIFWRMIEKPAHLINKKILKGRLKEWIKKRKLPLE